MGEKVLTVRLRAPVASFRRPLDHNYQRTLPLPPPTTILGIAGAALGLSDTELWKDKNGLWSQLKVSAWMEAEPGRARDLWTVLKIKGGKIETRSPYTRELLFYADYTLVYGGEEKMLEKLQGAFIDPAYALSLGREDELAIVEEVSLEEAEPAEPVFEATMVPVDIRELSSFRPVLREGAAFEPPIVEKLPVRFRVEEKEDKKEDKREVSRRAVEARAITFLPYGVQVEIPGLNAWKVRERTFAWFRFGEVSQPALL